MGYPTAEVAATGYNAVSVDHHPAEKPNTTYGSHDERVKVATEPVLNAAANAAPASTKEMPQVVTREFITNLAIVFGAVAVQAIVTKYLNKNDFSSEEAVNGADLALGLFMPHFINKVIKGNWNEVASELQQLGVLAGYTGWAALWDVVAFKYGPGESTQPWPVGQATVGAAINSVGFAATMVAANISGKRTYTKGEKLPKDKAKISEEEKEARRTKNTCLIAVSAALASVATRLFINPASTLGTVANMATFEIVNKLFKMGQKAEATTNEKIKIVARYAVASIATDCAAAAAVAGGAAFFGGTVIAPAVLSAVSINAGVGFAKLGLKAWLDREKTAKKLAKAAAAADEEAGLLPKPADKPAAKEKAAPSWLRRTWDRVAPYIINGGAAVAAVALNNINAVKNSVSALYATALVKHNVVMLSAREMYQRAVVHKKDEDGNVLKDDKGKEIEDGWLTTLQRTIAAVTPVIFAGAADIAGSKILGVPNELIATGTAVATSGTYLGMAVSTHFLPGDGDTDE